MQTMSIPTNWHWKTQKIEYSELNWNSLWSVDMQNWYLYDVTKTRHYQFDKNYEQITYYHV